MAAWAIDCSQFTTNPSMNKLPILPAILGCLSFVHAGISAEPTALPGYFNNAGRTDVLSGGVRMIEVQTPKGKFKVWTKRVGNNPKIKVLLLHGGPGVTTNISRRVTATFQPRVSSIITTISSVRHTATNQTSLPFGKSRALWTK